LLVNFFSVVMIIILQFFFSFAVVIILLEHCAIIENEMTFYIKMTNNFVFANTSTRENWDSYNGHLLWQFGLMLSQFEVLICQNILDIGFECHQFLVNMRCNLKY
jgi:hypothetical protein